MQQLRNFPLRALLTCGVVLAFGAGDGKPRELALHGGGVHARFTSRGVEVDGWRLDFGQATVVEPRVSGSRVEYQRPELIEWYQARPNGIEQGFTVQRRPSGDLLIVGTIAGPAATRATAGRLRLGRLLYADLSAIDAKGRPLPTELCWDQASSQVTLRIAAGELLAAEFPVTVDPLLSSATWTADPTDQADSAFGRVVASAGDVNGDGFADVIVGAPSWTGQAVGEGRASLFLGGPTGLSVAPSWTADPTDQPGAQFGSTVAGAGDVNGDGFADVLVGAYAFDAQALDEGRAYLYLGSAAGLSTTPARTLDPTDQSGAFFGYGLASAGDVNGDGFADVLVGAWAWDGASFNDEGRAFLYLGGVGGLSATPAWTLDPTDQPLAFFGYSMTSAGDVNGDGFGDVVVGAAGWTGQAVREGRVYLYLGSAAGLAATAVWTADPADQADAWSGAAVASGDLNGDGFSDVALSAYAWDGPMAGQANEGRVYLYLGSSTGLAAAPVWTLDPTDVQIAHFGYALRAAGDVNGDGFADLVIGARGLGRAFLYAGSADLSLNSMGVQSGEDAAGAGDVNGDGFADVVVGDELYDGQAVNEGRASLYEGTATGLATSTQPTSIADPTDQVSAWFGYSAASAGDVNGDGRSDVVVGAFGWDGQAVNEGRAWVHLGGSGNFSTTWAWTVDPTDQVDAWFGYSVASAGDVNGDGFADLLVGAYGWDGPSVQDEGRAYLFLGSAAGLSSTPAWTADPTDQAGASFGISVAGAGDVNGDGFADVLVGSQRWNGQVVGEGRAWLYLGSATGLSPIAAWTADPTDQQSAAFGISVASAGDVNGDGFADVLVGADGWNGQAIGEGRAWLYLGGAAGLSPAAAWTADPTDQAGAEFGASVASAGDVNGDGFADVVVGARGWDSIGGLFFADEGRAFLYLGSATGLSAASAWSDDPTNQTQGRFGASVASAGDFNGDGLDDVLVGSPGWGGTLGEGRAWLYLGNPTLSLTPGWASDPSDQFAALFGISVAGAGDVNGDGFGDVVVGAVDWDGQAIDEGRAWLSVGGDLGRAGLARELSQYQPDDTNRLGLGGRARDGVVLRGRVTQEAGPGGQLGLEVEVKQVGVAFNGTPTAVSLPVRGGQVARVQVQGLRPNLAYRWRARVAYPVGTGVGRWVSFGANGQAEPDFWIEGVDGGLPDAGPADAGATDAGPADAGATDAGNADAGLPESRACAATSECATGYCVDGVCCDSACAGACEACSLAAGAPANGACVLLAIDVVCRPSAGGCDLAETCTGTAASCPDDAVMPAGEVCRKDSRAGACDGAGPACRERGPLHLTVGCGCTGSATHFPWWLVVTVWLGARRRR